MQRSRRSSGVVRWAWAGALVASLGSLPGRGLAQPSPAVPTTQEVPPPVPAVEPGPSQPSSTQPAPTSPPVSSEPAPATAPPRAAPSQPAPPAASPAPPSAPAATTPAATTPAAAPATPAPASEPEPVPGVRQHDGFFVRVSSGFGAWLERLASEDSDVYGGSIEGRSTGITSAGDLSVGGTLGRGKVLALSLATTELLASTFRPTDSSARERPPSELDPDLRQLLVVGPTFLWYPDDRGGFMAEAGLGLALLVPSDAAPSNRRDEEVYAAGGLALSLSGGQQFFISDQFSIGVRGRVTFAAAGGEDEEGVRWLHLVRALPAVLCDVVYH